MRWSTATLATLLCSAANALPTDLKIEKRLGGPNVERANAVKEAFEVAWNGYYEYAFPNDELKPVSNGFGNSRNGWGASAVDALSTALIMREAEIVAQILDHIAGLDYTKTQTSEPTEVSLFETTIRYLGGMLAGYDLLKGPLSDLSNDTAKIDALLAQSVVLADAMKFGFDTESGVPHNDLSIETQTNGGSTSNGLATTGTLIMEWVRLSDLTGDAQYAQLVEKAESYLLSPKPADSEPFPGLVGTNINIATGEFEDARGGWSGGTDSFYEYLIKMFVYDQGRYSQLKDRWIAAADSTIDFLTSHPETKPEITYAAEYDGTELILQAGHLTCFHGGNFLLGGSVLGEQKYIDYGLALAEGCRNTYVSTVTQIGPEGFGWAADRVPPGQEAFFDEHGFYILSSPYILRPEVIETFYYAYRTTGDVKYQEWVWEAFQAINATTRVGSGFSAVSDVNAVGGGLKEDNQESFWFAEVLKYCFLTFADDAEYQIAPGGGNKWVFNTEAHPFKVRGEPVLPPNQPRPPPPLSSRCGFYASHCQPTLNTPRRSPIPVPPS